MSAVITVSLSVSAVCDHSFSFSPKIKFEEERDAKKVIMAFKQDGLRIDGREVRSLNDSCMHP